MKKIFYLSIFSSLLFLSACYSTSIKEGNNRVYSSLTEYLQSVPGIRVTGSDNNGHVSLTGSGIVTNAVSDDRPLFVVNGQQVGRSLPSLANILNANDIKKVKVLRSADQTSFYGINGSNGVIEITTKKK